MMDEMTNKVEKSLLASNRPPDFAANDKVIAGDALSRIVDLVEKMAPYSNVPRLAEACSGTQHVPGL
jgi:hypothetical protein